MKTLTPALQSADAARGKRPVWLVQIDFALVLRLSSWGTLTWQGNVWDGADVRVVGLDTSASGAQAGQLEVGNTDLAWSALILSDGVADRRIRIWQTDAGALIAGTLADGDAEPVFDGAGDDAEIAGDRCRITLSSASGRWLRSPREFGGDFTIVQPAGFRIPFNGEVFELANE